MRTPPTFPVHRAATTQLLVAALLTALLVASLPAWHEALHADCHEEDHECAVTMLLQGQATGADVPPPPVNFQGQEVPLPAPPLAEVIGHIEHRFPPGRAPPGLNHVHNPRHSS